MKKMRLYYVFVAYLTFLLFVTQCAGVTPSIEMEPLPSSVLWDNPCNLPCWYRIEPSKSTYDEVNKVLKNMDFIDIATLHERRDESSDLTWIEWKMRPPYVGSGIVRLRANVVESLLLTGNFDITLEQLVDHYGPPEAYHVDPSGGEIAIWEYDFYYPRLGAMFEAAHRAFPGPNVPPPVYAEAQVWSFELIKAGTLEEIIERLFDKYPPSRPLYRWHGFDPLPTPTLPKNNKIRK